MVYIWLSRRIWSYIVKGPDRCPQPSTLMDSAGAGVGDDSNKIDSSDMIDQSEEVEEVEGVKEIR